jgi:hypothetical protein
VLLLRLLLVQRWRQLLPRNLLLLLLFACHRCHGCALVQGADVSAQNLRSRHRGHRAGHWSARCRASHHTVTVHAFGNKRQKGHYEVLSPRTLVQ